MQGSSKTARGLALLACAGSLPVAAQLPVVFVVQERAPIVEDQDPNVLLAPWVAQELAASGRVSTVVWSLGDQVFTRWIEPERVKADPTKPELRAALDLANRNGAEYVLWVKGLRTAEGLRPTAEMYQRGRKVWSFAQKSGNVRLPTGIRVSREERDRWQQDAENLLAASGALVIVVDGSPDWELTAVSVARSWTAQLFQGPLSRLPAAIAARSGGETSSTDDPKPPDPDALLTLADKMAEEGKTHSELAYVRRAIDADPKLPSLRLREARLLFRLGMPAEARASAEAGAALADDPSPYWEMVAEACLETGDLAAAREAVARMVGMGSGRSVETEALALLLEGDHEQATAKLRPVTGPRAAAWRAVASALGGRIEDTQAEIGLLTDEDRTLASTDYAALVILLERAVEPIVDELRAMPPKIRSGDSGALSSEAGRLSARAECLLLVVRGLGAPKAHERSHDGRRLAHALLLQAARETLAFATDLDDDTRLESALSLTEAVRNFAAVRETHAAERRNAAQGRRTDGDGLDRSDSSSVGGSRVWLLRHGVVAAAPPVPPSR